MIFGGLDSRETMNSQIDRSMSFIADSLDESSLNLIPAMNQEQ